MRILLKNGTIVDGQSTPWVSDILVENGIITDISPHISATPEKQIDCSGLVIMPGLVDMHVHFRDPGQTEKEDIVTGIAAARNGGFTACACMPNTTPVADTPEIISYMVDKAKKECFNLLPIAAATKGLQGITLSDFQMLKAAGAVAVSDDGRPIENASLMSSVLIAAQKAGLPVISHCEDLSIINGGIINKGVVSDTLRVKGMDRASENIITAREIILAKNANTAIHIAHVSTKEAVGLLRAVQSNPNITSETAPHYFTLTEDICLKDSPPNANYRMNPPLRTEADRLAITKGLTDGIFSAIVTDHAPHTAASKADFSTAPNGIVGLETSLALVLTKLYHTKLLSLCKIAQLMSLNPRRILGINGGEIAVGEKADLTIIDTEKEWTVDSALFKSKSHNTPFDGMHLKGKAVGTITSDIYWNC